MTGRIRRVQRALMLLPLLMLPAVCGALPVAGAYPSRKNTLNQPGETERKAFDMMQADRARHGLEPVVWDGQLSAVAREHSRDMADHSYFAYHSPRLGTMDYRLHRAGVSGANSRYAIYQANSLNDVISRGGDGKTPVHLERATHLGLGVVSKGFPRRLHVTVISIEKYSRIEPFPTQPILGRAYRLRGAIDRRFGKAMLIITLPDGSTVDEPLKLSPAGEFDTTVRFDKGKGKYTVEITGQGRLGPEVLELMRCYAGVPYPAPEPPKPNATTPTDLRRAEEIMFQMVNEARAAAGLPVLDYDKRLAGVARTHSTDMLRHRFFKHVSPTRGDLSARMKRAGLDARRFTENLAKNPDLATAHRGLMNSPGHRKNILDREVTRVGIGIVRGEGRMLIITQNFAQDFPLYDTAELAARFREAINTARAGKGLAALRYDADLARIALENAKSMMSRGRLDYDRAKALLKKTPLRVKSVQIAVLQSTDPPKPEQMVQVLDRKYDLVGIGIAQNTSGAKKQYVWTTVLVADE